MPGNHIPNQLVNGMDCIRRANLVDKVRYERVVLTRFGVDCLRLRRFCQGKSREGPNEWTAGSVSDRGTECGMIIALIMRDWCPSLHVSLSVPLAHLYTRLALLSPI